MRKLFLPGLVILSLALFIPACQSPGMLPLGSGVVSPENRIALAPGGGSGAWQGQDLSVDYRYSMNQSNLELSGTADFASNMTTNFTFINDFQLSVLFFDQSGKVLENRGLATDRGSLDPVHFRTRIALPPGTAGMAFAYQGTALATGDDEGGGGGLTAFWQYPVR
jgi:hypothetical protein